MSDYLAISGDEFGAMDEFGADEFGADEFGAARRRLRLPPAGLETIYGLDSGSTIAAAASSLVTALPQRRNRPKKLSMDTTLAGYFAISSITVGVEPVLSTSGAIPAAIFSQNSTAPAFKAVVCDVGMTVSVNVTNTYTSAERFIAAVIADELPYRR